MAEPLRGRRRGGTAGQCWRRRGQLVAWFPNIILTQDWGKSRGFSDPGFRGPGVEWRCSGLPEAGGRQNADDTLMAACATDGATAEGGGLFEGKPLMDMHDAMAAAVGDAKEWQLRDPSPREWERKGPGVDHACERGRLAWRWAVGPVDLVGVRGGPEDWLMGIEGEMSGVPFSAPGRSPLVTPVEYPSHAPGGKDVNHRIRKTMRRGPAGVATAVR